MPTPRAEHRESRPRAGRGGRLARVGLAGGIAFWCISGLAHAERAPKEGPQDPRIRTVVYSPRDVVRIEVHYGYHTAIELAEDERIQTLTMGDSESWEAVKDGSERRIFLKPREEGANTNMIVVTDRRTYTFALVGRSSKQPVAKDPSMTWNVRFEYPGEAPKLVDRPVALPTGTTVKVGLDPTKMNFAYRYAGSRKLVPTLLFDDGTSTYFRFENMKDLPGIFVVDPDKKEAIANYRVEGPYVVVQRVAKQFSLRIGGDLACIFNESTEGEDKGNSVNGPREQTVREDDRVPRRPGQYVRSRKTSLPERGEP
jgi:type IV secretion system protein VirB9